jgi:hypothetical protein
MYRRGGNKEDPWISLKDHFTASKEGLIVYGENNYAGHNKGISAHGGGDVYIRMSVEEEKKWDSTPVQVNYLGTSYCSVNNKCNIGEGDCDTDSECKTGLKCGQRSNFEHLPGLTGYEKFLGKGGAMGNKDVKGNIDYCYDPNYYQKAAESDPNWFDPTPVKVEYLGDSYCTPSKKCELGKGDCDKDSDCKHGLKCGQRNKGEKLPGIFGFEKFEGKNGKDKEKDGDYCFDPEYDAKAAAVKAAQLKLSSSGKDIKTSKSKFDHTPVQVNYLGTSYCSVNNKCDIG